MVQWTEAQPRLDLAAALPGRSCSFDNRALPHWSATYILPQQAHPGSPARGPDAPRNLWLLGEGALRRLCLAERARFRLRLMRECRLGRVAARHLFQRLK